MPAEAIFSEFMIEQVLAQIFARGRISRLDQQLLIRTLQSESVLTTEQRTVIQRIFEALQNGWLKVVD
ncbi:MULTISPECIES: hypothetical protein [unclassified Roseofilum]|uniref:hypothetical protein n=1 Tax=unclassified Roseofilum TaxID=2620099 RepID=UPI000E9CB386|nr:MULTISPECIES: hypothetical protein [unclassified Roseofilum]MBP0006961.1 hypothetical protein [Roseofilum sp. Belize Diploria]MBP0032868.1 hypothetical protein [Roseofilum sp. Belize BBD 4]HBQ97107.1 hypothetical protein [Cyanobacteria bacterium UBA11691]